jgi:N-acetylglucosaminyldiphosphoundecaprenol N-acetyl-beta-D-mannosaminyltransferase
MNSIRILGVRVDDVTMTEALARVEEFVREDEPRQIATVNPEFIVAAQKNVEFRAVLNNTALNLPDGVGLLWAARRSRTPLRERVAGVDTVERICERASALGWRVFLLGAREGVAAWAAEMLTKKFAGLQIAGTFAGSPAREVEDAQVAMIRAAGAQILFVAYGAPAQDVWIARNLPRLSVRVAMGVGGSLDYLAGVIPRAPGWMQRAGLEWLFRLRREPWRWRRQIGLAEFVVRMVGWGYFRTSSR